VGTESASRNRTALWRNVGLAAFAVPFVVYLYTLSPSLDFEDPAEFALGAAVLGVDHPYGYPLYTLFGHAFTILPWGEIVQRVNAASAAAAAGAAAVVFLLVWELLGGGCATRARCAGAWAGAGLFAFSRTFWSQAVIAEVYTLNALLVAAALYCGVKAVLAKDTRWFFAAAFAAGLAVANHPSSLLVTLPLIVYAGWRTGGRGTLKAVLFFLAGVSFYVYLPLRASRGPVLNWGAPADLPGLVGHLTRQGLASFWWGRYRFLGDNFLGLGKHVLTQMGPGLALIAGAGGWLLWRRPAARALAIIGGAAGLFAVLPLTGMLDPFQLEEIDVWYIPVFLFVALFAGGAVGTLAAIGRRRPVVFATLAAAALLPLIPLIYNFPFNDHRGRHFGTEHGRNLLRTHPYRALSAFPPEARGGLFEEAYLISAERRRPDVLIIEPTGTLYSDVAAVRIQAYSSRERKSYTWWPELVYYLASEEDYGTVIYATEDPIVAALGARFVPFGLAYYLRTPGSNPPPTDPPWERLEYGAWDAIGRSLPTGRKKYAGIDYRVWANYHILKALDHCAKGALGRARAELDNARPCARYDARAALLLASTYMRCGFPEDAIPLYAGALPYERRFPYDLPAFRQEYVHLLNSLGLAYLNAGDVEQARDYFRESLRVEPDQPELAAYLAETGP
jgi:hypothetical protein